MEQWTYATMIEVTEQSGDSCTTLSGVMEIA